MSRITEHEMKPLKIKSIKWGLIKRDRKLFTWFKRPIRVTIYSIYIIYYLFFIFKIPSLHNRALIKLVYHVLSFCKDKDSPELIFRIICYQGIPLEKVQICQVILLCGVQ